MKRVDEERRHHDLWAKSEARDISGDFDHFLSLENKWVLKHLPSVEGKSVLDIGCGLGEASLYFARRGARVTAVDVSEGMIEHCVAVGRENGLRIEGMVMPAEDLQLDDEAYDVVYAANVLHHLEHSDELIRKVSRTVRSDGICFFMEPLRYNPVINIYRRMATNVRTPDERPVGFEILRTMRESFREVRYSTTWLLSLMIFLKYYFVDRVHPNADRYWKRILDEPESSRVWLDPFIKSDKMLCRICPPLRYLCWNIVIAASSPLEQKEPR